MREGGKEGEREGEKEGGWERKEHQKTGEEKLKSGVLQYESLQATSRFLTAMDIPRVKPWERNKKALKFSLLTDLEILYNQRKAKSMCKLSAGC